MVWVPNFVLSQDISPCLSPAVSEDSGDAVAALLSELGENLIRNLLLTGSWFDHMVF